MPTWNCRWPAGIRSKPGCVSSAATMGSSRCKASLPEIGELAFGQGRFPWLLAGGKTCLPARKTRRGPRPAAFRRSAGPDEAARGGGRWSAASCHGPRDAPDNGSSSKIRLSERGRRAPSRRNRPIGSRDPHQGERRREPAGRNPPEVRRRRPHARRGRVRSWPASAARFDSAAGRPTPWPTTRCSSRPTGKAAKRSSSRTCSACSPRR